MSTGLPYRPASSNTMSRCCRGSRSIAHGSRPRGVRMPAHPEQRLVDMGVRLDQAGQQHLPRAVDARDAGGHRRRVEGPYLAALEQDIVPALPPDEDIRDQDGRRGVAWLLL